MNDLYHHGILEMKWGVRRYQNKDGSLTEAGKKRYNREIMRNNQKKKKDRADEDSLKDPSRWVKEDIGRSKKVTDSLGSITNQAQKAAKESRPKATKKRMDLSSMTDQELRQKINRELVERQYNDLFGKTEEPRISKGRKIVETTLSVAGSALAVGSSALSLALAIKELSG